MKSVRRTSHSTPLLPYRRGPLRRGLLYVGHLLAERIARVIGPKIFEKIDQQVPAGGPRFPHIPTRFRRRLRSPAQYWGEPSIDPPAELLSQPGIGRDPAEEQRVFENAPLHDFFGLHLDEVAALGPLATMMVPATSVAPRLSSANRRLAEAQQSHPTRPPRSDDPHRLTEEFKSYAASIGLSGTAVTAYDPKFTFAEFAGRAVGDTMVVSVLEQNYHATQRIPAHRSEVAALSTYGELEDRMALLARWLQDRGYEARPEDFKGESMFIAYAVAAGLGQLGLNGQLLTPFAGSRCRLNVLSTNAPLVRDKPVDYGIEGVCDRCQICVRRCPVGAITNSRRSHRGVIKAKINTKRCLPLMMQSAGCSICMKVCPVQRYGLDEVLDHYRRTGEILGKDSDDLEGYDWPLDGRHYGPAATPHVPDTVVKPPGFEFDPTRCHPVSADCD